MFRSPITGKRRGLFLLCFFLFSPLIATSNCWEWGVDLLFWQARQEGLAFAETRTYPSGEISLSLPDTHYRSRIKDPHFSWRPGFRLRASRSLPCTSLNCALNWTHYFGRAHGKADPSIGSFKNSFLQTKKIALPYWTALPSFQQSFFGEKWILSEASWKLHMDLVDLELGKTFCICLSTELRPHLGLRFTDITQHYGIWNDLLEESLPSDPVQKDKYQESISLTSRLRGVGIRAGVDLSYALLCDTTLFGSMASALVSGHTTSKQSDEGLLQSISETTEGKVFTPVETDSSRNLYTTHWELDMTLGIAWDCKQLFPCFPLLVKLSWENHLFLNQNSFYRWTELLQISHNSNYNELAGNLNTRGITLSLSSSF